MRQVLLEADERIEQKMRHLKRRAGKLLMRIERGGIRIVGHAQSLGGCRDGTGNQEGDDRDKEMRAHGVAMSP